MHSLLSEVSNVVSYSTLVPPALFILMATAGVLLAWRWRRFGLTLATVAILCLYAASTPATAFLLIRAADSFIDDAPPPDLDQPPGAIIVLSADAQLTGDPQHPVTAGPLTLQRIFAAARQERRLRLPVLVSGGKISDTPETLAAMMAEVFDKDLGMPVKWREERSTNTFENAQYSAEILRRAGIGAAYVVTHRWHMARALWAFRRVGYPVIALPLGREPTRLDPELDEFLPSIPSLQHSYYALHELIGLAWYRVHYGRPSGG